MKNRLLIITAVLLAFATGLQAQAPDLTPQSATNPVPTVVFQFDLPQSSPSHYAITVDSLGRASYRSEPLASDPNEMSGDPFMTSFVVSNPTRDRIFALTQELDYFKSNDFDYRGKVANMGTKTLLYREADHEYRASYNYTTNPKMQELSSLFQGISATLEFVRRLQWLHRFQPLGLDAELKKLEADQKAGRLQEAQLLQPVLSGIIANHAVMNIARRRAQSVLARIGTKDQAKR